MAEISANLIKELREKTGAGVLDCKKALTETNGDLEKAVENLRKSGAAKADKKSGRITAEGRVALKIAPNEAVAVEVNCETDFVAKTDEFQNFVDQLAEHILKTKPENVEALLQADYQGKTLKEVVQGLVAKTGENITVRRLTRVHVGASEKVGSYIHMGNKIGVLVRAKGSDKLTEAALRDVAMHVAAANPQYLNRDSIPAAAIEKEKEIYREQMKDLNKPAPMLEKIIEGKIAKFADEVCLIHQAYVKDPTGKQTVADYLKTIDPSATVLEFIRYQVGEGIQKKEDNFAAEVAKTLQSN
ncbi:MAG: elongation factor Ts [Deltaproteobacteria bacterium]|nr:elongation factor Ts [Deltaproteobacteria bacterium]